MLLTFSAKMFHTVADVSYGAESKFEIQPLGVGLMSFEVSELTKVKTLYRKF